MSSRYSLLAVILALASVFAPLPAHTHAAVIEAEAVQAIRLQASYDRGEPMAHAQVIIHALDDPASPWGQGVTDRDGNFDFIPDAQTGRWAVQVRQAGHGALAHVEIGAASPVILTSSAGGGWLQRAVMVALVAWGALGTALFVRRRTGRKDAFV